MEDFFAEIPPMPYSPDLTDVWMYYTGPRYKDTHHMILKDGRVVANYRPNGNNWSRDIMPDAFDSDDRRVTQRPLNVHDDEVLCIKLAPDSQVSEDQPTGEGRRKRTRRMFSGCIPDQLMFTHKDMRVIKSEVHGGFVAISDSSSTHIQLSGDRYHLDEGTEITKELQEVVDLLNLNFVHKWPFFGDADA